MTRTRTISGVMDVAVTATRGTESAPAARDGSGWRWWLFGTLLLAVAISLAVWPSHDVIGDDGVTYVSVGLNWIAGRGFTNALGAVETNAPPLYPLLIGLVSRLTGDGVLAAKLIALVSGVALLVPCYALGAMAFRDRRVGVMAAAIMTALPLRVFYSVEEMTETPFLLLVLSALALVVWIVDCQPKRVAGWWALSGVLLGLIYLMRPAGLLFGVCAAVVAVTVRRSEPVMARVRRRLLPMAVVLALVAAPYVFFLHRHLGGWSLTGQRWAYAAADEMSAGVPYHHLWRLDDEGRLVVSQAREIAAESASAQWQRHLRRWTKNALAQGEMIATAGSPVLLILLGAAAADAARRRWMWSARWLCGVAGVLLVALPTFFIEPRYYLPLFALLVIVAARGWWVVAEGSSSRRWIAAALALGLLVYQARDISRDLRWEPTERPIELKTFGVWMREHLADRPGAVLAIKQTTPFYAGMGNLVMPHGSLELLQRYAAARSMRYLVLAEREAADYHPELRALLEQPGDREGLRLVHVDSQLAGFRVALYEFGKPGLGSETYEPALGAGAL